MVSNLVISHTTDTSGGHKSPWRGCHTSNQTLSDGINAVPAIPLPSNPQTDRRRRIPSVDSGLPSTEIVRNPNVYVTHGSRTKEIIVTGQPLVFGCKSVWDVSQLR